MARTANHYLTDSNLRPEIWKSKLSFCASLDPLPDQIVNCDFAYSGEVRPVDMNGFVRLFTWDHVPTSDKKRPGQRSGIGFERANFRPFKIYHNGVEIVRSHWQGGLGNGYFSIDHGRLTNKLGEQIIKLAARYASRPNFASYSYRDEMECSAIVALTRGILQFDDSMIGANGYPVNSFAYATQITHNAFLRTLKDEKKAQTIRDMMLSDAGAKASFSYEGGVDRMRARDRLRNKADPAP